MSQAIDPTALPEGWKGPEEAHTIADVRAACEGHLEHTKKMLTYLDRQGDRGNATYYTGKEAILRWILDLTEGTPTADEAAAAEHAADHARLAELVASLNPEDVLGMFPRRVESMGIQSKGLAMALRTVGIEGLARPAVLSSIAAAIASLDEAIEFTQTANRDATSAHTQGAKDCASCGGGRCLFYKDGAS